MKKIIAFAFLCLLYVGCSNPTHLEILNFEEALTKTTKISIADYVIGSKFIPLETDSSCLISSIEKVVATNNNFFILDSEFSLYVFNTNGDFIRSVGTKGKGPNEYTYLSDFAVDPINNTIYLNGNNGIQLFDFNGNYRNQINNNGASQFLFYGGKLVMSMPDVAVSEGSKDAILIVNKEGGVEKRFKTYNTRKTGFDFDFSLLYKSDNCVYYKEELGDTLFSINKSLNKKAEKVLNLGKFKIPKSNYDFKFIDSSNDFYRFVDVFDLPSFSIYKMQNGIVGGLDYVFFNKKTGQFAKVSKDSNNEFELFLDNDFTIPFTPVYVYDNHLIGYIYSYNFLEVKGKSKVTGKTNLLNEISINDNPIFLDIELK